MKKLIVPIFLLLVMNLNSYAHTEDNFVSTSVVKTAKSKIMYTSVFSEQQIERGVKQVAQLWQPSDGSTEQFLQFCETYFCKNKEEKEKLFNRICENFEIIFGHNNRITIDLLKPLHVVGYESVPVDDIFGAYNALSHFNEDMFTNKLAFVIVLNFPYYTLREKQNNGHNWSDLEWGYVRLGDLFTSRITAQFLQPINEATAAADNYISNYNINMGMILGEGYSHYWPNSMKLISHWGLRDELKSCYADKIHGLEKQDLIYHVMRQIINQDIPIEVLNNETKYGWYPPSNGIYLSKIEINSHPEQNNRYQHLLNIFKAEKDADVFYPNNPNFISRKFEEEYEISVDETKQLFHQLLSSPQVQEVANLISKRLNRKLQPFDIWYDGFKNRSDIDPAVLDSLTTSKYPTKADFEKNLPDIMKQLGFNESIINLVCSHVTVESSIGAGHAWESMMKTDNAMLRTRIGEKGMDYKGYNIGVHEFGHNVEQTISLHNVPNYFMRGVPNTAFTEALAFLFQAKDLELLGVTKPNELTNALTTLDIFWGCYEIMGVSMVDIKVWEWMYANPNATAIELKTAVISIAKEVWNQYFAPAFGVKDQSILAIYSHMIDSPLYLSAYPIGHIIHFQLDNYMKDKQLGTETERIYSLGRLTPNLWMKKAVGNELSVTPLLQGTSLAIKQLKEFDKNQKKSK